MSKKDDDITLDFGKALGFLKKKNKKEHHAKPGSEDMALDLKGAWPKIKKLSIFFLILIPLLISFYYRTMPNRLEITDDFARSTIYNGLQSNIRNQVNQNFPNLPPQTKEGMVQQQFSQLLKEQGPAIEDAIKRNSDYIRSQFKDNKGYTVLGDIDSYFWLRYAQNIIDHGYPGDEIRDGVQYDNHMLAPYGLPITNTINMYPYIEAYLFRFLSFFNPNITLMQAAFYTPLFLSILAIFAAFFIGRIIAGNIGGFFSALLTAVHPTIISRSLGSDNDIVNIVFPLLILLLFILAFDAKSLRKKLIFSSLTGFLIGIYSFAWTGYWYVFYFLIATIIAYIAYKIIYNKINTPNYSLNNPELRHLALFFIAFLAFSAISIFLFSGSREIADLPFKGLRTLTIKEASKGESLWPNVYTTVAELNAASLTEVINGVGGDIFFLMALMGIILSLTDFREHKWESAGLVIGSLLWFVILIGVKTQIQLILFLALMLVPVIAGVLLMISRKYSADIKYAIILIMWFSATLYAATKGVRFTLLILPAFIVSLALFINKAYHILSDFISGQLSLSRNVSRVIIILLIGLMFIDPVRSGFYTSRSYIPNVNDGWVQSLEKIKQESQPNAIINSWWDFGHWFKYFADRAVTADGASQNTPQAHWVGKILLTNDENRAVSILRMLDCGANSAFDELNAKNQDTLESVNVLNNIMMLDKTEAKKVLLNHVDSQTADKILSRIDCSPPEDFFITSEDMVGKSGVWAHFGIWDFQKARIYYYFKTKSHEDFSSSLQKEFNFTKDTAEKYYYQLQSLKADTDVNNWIAPWPSYGGLAACSGNGDTLTCNMQVQQNSYIPFTVNLTTKDIRSDLPGKTMYPNSFGYVENNTYKVKKYGSDVIGYSVALVNESNTYYLLFMSPELVDSMFTRLFYFDGIGLQHFEKFSDVTDITGQRIIVWKVKWD